MVKIFPLRLSEYFLNFKMINFSEYILNVLSEK